MQNYMFQIRNAIFRTLEVAQTGAEVVMNKGNTTGYPYILIDATRKKVLPNDQKELTTDLYITTQDLSVVSVSSILEKIETAVTRQALQMYVNYYSVHFAYIIDSSVFPNEDGVFCGKISIISILDEK